MGGHRSGDYEDIIVSASRGFPAEELQSIVPFDITGGTALFDGDFLAGFGAEQLALGARETWPTARARIEEMERSRCAIPKRQDAQAAESVYRIKESEFMQAAERLVVQLV